MLMPKRVKYRKQMRGRMRGTAQRSRSPLGNMGCRRLSQAGFQRVIEAARRAIVRALKRRGKVWIGFIQINLSRKTC
jgi:large subunit ribosomal protein L16